MATIRERLDRLETSVQDIQTSIQQLLDRGQDRRNPWGSRASNQGGRHKKRASFRMDFPRFSGEEEPRTWLNRANQFFIANDIHGRKKLTLAAYNLEGDANQWWQWFERANRDRQITWKQFEKGLLIRFGHGDYEINPNESMCKLRQRGDLKEYLVEFEKLMNCLPNWDEEALMGAFMAGLKEEIAREVRLFKPTNLQMAIELAKRKDEQIQSGRRVGDTSELFHDKTNYRGLSEIAEQAMRRAEVARLKEIHTLKGHVESVVKLKGLDIETIRQNYTV